MFVAEKDGKTVVFLQNFDAMYFARSLKFEVRVVVGHNCDPHPEKYFWWNGDDCPESLMHEIAAGDPSNIDELVAMQAIKPGSKEFYEFFPVVIEKEANVKFIQEHFLIKDIDEPEFFRDDVDSLAVYTIACDSHNDYSDPVYRDFVRLMLRDLREGKIKFDFPDGLRKEDYI